MQAHVVDEHFLKFNALLSHVLVIDDLVGSFCVCCCIKFSFNKQVTSLSVNPNPVVLHDDLLKHSLG